MLGTLTTAWSRLRETSSLTELRDTLSQSAWGDPGGDTPADIAFGVHVAWALRVAATVPDASSWACGALALLVARRRLQQRRELPQRVAVRAARILNATAVESHDLASFAAALPARARWALTAVNDVGELWRGEVAWWLRLERDGFQLLGRPAFSRARTIGAAAGWEPMRGDAGPRCSWPRAAVGRWMPTMRSPDIVGAAAATAVGADPDAANRRGCPEVRTSRRPGGRR